MNSNQVGGIILIVLGAIFLNKTLNFLPSLSIVWPVLLIILGIIGLTRKEPRRRTSEEDNVIIEIDGESFPLLKGLVAIPALLIALLVGLIMLGFLGPFFLIFLLFIPFILFLKLGWFFLRLIIPIIFAAVPLLVIILLIFLIF